MAIRKPITKGFEEILLERGIVTEGKLREFFAKVTTGKKGLEQFLLDSGIPEEKIAVTKAKWLGYEFLDLSRIPQPSAMLLKHIKPAYAKNYKILPISYEANILTVAMVEPRNFMALDEVVRLYKDANFEIHKIDVVVTTTKHIFSAIARFYSLHKERAGLDSILDQIAESYRPHVEIAVVSREDANENSAPMVLLANKIIEEAFAKKSSDVHLEPAPDHLRVRYRIDGELAEVMRVPKYAQDALITRFKIMSDMRIDEKRQPQDGRINFTKYNAALPIDLRVSTIPTPLGEDVVMRLLDKKSAVLSLDMLGLNEQTLKLYKNGISAPHGIILHVGPTGSGKTTALYAALNALDKPDTKIVTAEEPVEYTLGGQIIQSNINPATGYTFARAIRAFLRHDPDIILIGEIRDLETAKIAVEASLTGHLVFSTLHTNDAIGTVTRLTEMGVEPYLVGDSLILVCAQRLIRRICGQCKFAYNATGEEVDMAKGDIKAGSVLYRGKGCSLCEGTGYRGRTGIFELFMMSRTLRSLFIKGATTDHIRQQAAIEGMQTLRQDAIEKALQGITTIDEVVSSTFAEQ
jgi:type IV pilus assembly protein PilB